MSDARRISLIVLGILPLVIMAGMLFAFSSSGSGFLGIQSRSQQLEKIDFEKVTFLQDGITAKIFNSGPTEVTISQILVNDAIWTGTVTPSEKIPRLGSAVIDIPYQWVEGEPIQLTVITSNGLTFSKAIDIATLTPVASSSQALSLALLGTYVGVIPVFLGLAWFPFMNRLSPRWLGFFLSFTVGLLVFLGIDTLREAFELVERIPSPLQGIQVLAMGFAATFLVLMMLGERFVGSIEGSNKAKSALLLSYMIALGIGLHNLGEGLSIGGALAVGEVGLGVFLILGFTIHNTTEGLAILSPLTGSRFRYRNLLFLGILAGAPTIAGSLIGGLSYSNFWALLFFAVGAGAIFQVVYEISANLGSEKSLISSFRNPNNLAGFLAGLLAMYTTALFVAL